MRNKGFTIIEMLVVIFIITVLSTVLYANFGEIRDQLALKRATHQLVQDLRKAQEMAMSSAELKEVESCSLPLHFASLNNLLLANEFKDKDKDKDKDKQPLHLLGDVIILEQTTLSAQGYGIYIDFQLYGNKSYKLYADTAADITLKDCPAYSGSGTECWEYYTPADCIYQTINIQEKGVIIKEIKNTIGSVQKVSINFKPPNPNTNIKWLQSSKNEVEIILALEKNPLKTKTVVVNRAGMIEIR